jgi:anthranilate phosphoribosyltransferase
LSNELRPIFEALATRRDLSREQARDVLTRLIAGELPEATLGALLGAIAVKGEAVDELVGAAQAMRASAIRVRCESDCIDTCGTGGDGISTFNVSTTAAIIAAAAGATVAKHGNRSTTRVCGSTEVLTELGINVEADVAVVEQSLSEIGIGYLNARLLHPAMKQVAKVRAALPFRTIFNLLGPLTNPGGARRQVVGVPRPALMENMARALIALDVKHAWVVHGSDGLCDLTITGPTAVIEVRDGARTEFQVLPEQVGLARGPLAALRVSSIAQSARVVMEVLHGEGGARLDHALLNAGAALVVAGVERDLTAGIQAARRAVTTGAARTLLDRWRTLAPIPQSTFDNRQSTFPS